MPNNAINTDGQHARAFGAHVFAAGYGGRYVFAESRLMKRLLILSMLAGMLMSGAQANEQDELRTLQMQANEAHRKLLATGKLPPPDDPAKWVAARESGYVNCLLTVLGEGPANSATVIGGQRLPDLSALAAGNSSLLAWTHKLTFNYDSLSSQVVTEILSESFELQKTSEGRLRTVLVKNDGAPLAVLFTAKRTGSAIKLGVVRAQ